MYEEVRGNIFEANVQVLVNPVNCRGVMGAGLARAFAERFPQSMLYRYKKACSSGILRPGYPYLDQKVTPWILHFPTKDHWKESSSLLMIEKGLQVFVSFSCVMDIQSIAFPKLGCGLGNLSWEREVQPLMKKYLDLPFLVQIYV